MSYKYSTGSVRRGDIYDEDDAQANTYIDWTSGGDAVGIITGGSTTFIVSASSVGVGTTSPASVFEVSGSQAGNLATTEANITLGETHFMVVLEGDVGYPGGAAALTASLPAADTCAGRIYHIFNQTGMHEDPYTGGSAKILFTGNNEIDGSDHIELDGNEGNTSISLVSNGGDDQDGSWLIFGQYTPQDEGE